MAEVAVIGGGPSGSVFAARMAALGHAAHLIEAEAFPRPRLGESLTPGVAAMLKPTGFGGALEAGRPVEAVEARWEGAPRRREFAANAGFLVDRGAFDLKLLQEARARGVVVHQPARARSWRREGGRWRLEIETTAGSRTLKADFLADARGRGGAARTGKPTIALYAYWRVSRAPATPRIAAIDDGWVWGVPLPNGLYNTLAFLDPNAEREPLMTRLRRRVEAGGLFEGCGEAELAGPVRAIDATAALAADPVGLDYLLLGDRALALDPLSSSGVQKAIQGALSGAIVANTLIGRPERARAAIGFYVAQLAAASEQHAAWAGGHYAAAGREGPFWRARARAAEAEPEPAALDREFLASAPLALSPQAEWRDTPCLGEAFVTLEPALTHPHLPRPVAYLGGTPLAPLLQGLQGPRTALDLARGWRPQVPFETGLQIAAWLAARAVLAPLGQARTPQ
jgi:flavin-dependent dehydrogenase